LPSERKGEPKRPYVVDFEGPDGSGKTTVLRGVAGKLRRAGCRVVTYKTPGPSPTGRFAVSYGNRRGTAPISRMLLFLANTVEETKTMVSRCARTEADFLLLDRYYLCSIVFGLAYVRRKGIAADVDVSELVGLFEALSGDHIVRPDLYVVIDVDEEERLRRVSSGRGAGFLERDSEFQRLVREYYKSFWERNMEKVVWVTNERNALERTVGFVASEVLRRSGRSDTC
jgi:dTMP kinase